MATEVSEEVYKPRVSVISKKTRISTKSSMEQTMPEEYYNQESIKPDENLKPCFMQHIKDSSGLNLRNCILLDNESTVHAFCNKNLLEKVWATTEVMTLVGNGGKMTTNQKGKIRNLKTNNPVWFHSEYITNILSLALIKKQYKVTYDSSKSGAFIVHIPGSHNLYFNCYSNGLHMIECNDQCFSFVQTLAGNMEGYSKRQIKDAKEALALLPKLSYPSKQDFIKMIRAGSIKNCTVLEEDVERMYDIWKVDVASMKGKTTRTKPDRVRQSIVALPAEILEKNKIIHLSMDIFFNGDLAFCISLSRDILLNTIQHLTSRKKQDKLDCIKMICQLYYRRGF